MRSWIRFVLNYRKTVVVASGLLTFFLISQLKSLTLIIDADHVLPQSHPYVKTSKTVESMFGNKHLFAIGITANEGTILEKRYLEKLERISNRVLESEGVLKNNVLSLLSSRTKDIRGDAEGMTVTKLIEKYPETPEEVEALKARILSNPVYKNLLISEDFRTTQILAEYGKLPGGQRALEDEVLKAVAPERDSSVTIAIGGLPVFHSLIEKYSDRMGFLFPIALIVIGLIHYEAFRSLQALFLPLVTALLAVIWALGGLILLGYPMDVFNATTPILILAIAAGHAVQILKRYYEEFAAIEKSGKFKSDRAAISKAAVEESLTKVGPVMVTACLVAAIGFFSLIIFEIQSIRVFGAFTGFGILSALFLELTFIPAVRALLPPPGEREISREGKFNFWDKWVNVLYSWVLQKKAVVISSFVILVIACSFGITRIVVDNSDRSFFAKDIPQRLEDDQLNKAMGGTNTLYILYEGKEVDDIKRPEAMKAIDRLHRELNETPHIGKTISIADFIKQMNQAMNNNKSEFYSIPDSKDLIAQYLLLYASSGSPNDFDTFVDYDYRTALGQAFMKTDRTTESEKILAHIAKAKSDYFPPFLNVRAGGLATNTVALNDVMIEDKILNILQIMGAVLVVTSIVFRSIWAGFLILVPLVIAVVVNFGVMALTGITLSLATVFVSAMAVGIGADYGIYMSYRLREELAKGLDQDKAFQTAYRSAGKAAIFVSTAIAGGFGVLMLSFNFYIHLWLGLLISLAMVVSAFAALTLFPALILLIKPNFIYGAQK